MLWPSSDELAFSSWRYAMTDCDPIMKHPPYLPITLPASGETEGRAWLLRSRQGRTGLASK